jgi:hypothetical protein
VNVSNLMMVRAEGRRHELGVRAALGASRRFLLESSMAESVLYPSLPAPGVLGGILLIGAGLLLASFQRIMNDPRGFQTENVFAVDLALSVRKYQTAEQRDLDLPPHR